MPESAQKVLHDLTSAGLLASDEATMFEQEVAVGVEALLDRLLSDGRITKYQADKFMAGQAGDVSFGDYVVLEELGRGGMGTVLLGNHRRMDRKVAIKVLSTVLLDSEAAVARFYQEVKVAAKLTHPNIVHAYDAGERHGFHYLVMEYVEGHDLARVQDQLGAMPVELALDYIIQAARGLEYAHGKGIVHRDIKPSNILLDHEGTVKILDMGLARIGGLFGDDRDSHQLTTTGQMMGTVDYMSPEQAEDSRQADHRSDIYSLGCTFYRLLTNEAPFARDTIVKTILAHREAPPPTFTATSNLAWAPINRVFQQMVAKNPKDRYQTTTSLLQELTQLAEELPEADAMIFVDQTPVKANPIVDRDKYTTPPNPAVTIAARSTPNSITTANTPSSAGQTAPPRWGSDEDDIVMAQEVHPPEKTPVHQIGEQPHRGRRWTILGAISVLTAVGYIGGILGVITWIFARSDLDEMRRGLRDSSGQNLTVAGKILGMIAAAISGLTVFFTLIQ